MCTSLFAQPAAVAAWLDSRVSEALQEEGVRHTVRRGRAGCLRGCLPKQAQLHCLLRMLLEGMAAVLLGSQLRATKEDWRRLSC